MKLFKHRAGEMPALRRDRRAIGLIAATDDARVHGRRPVRAGDRRSRKRRILRRALVHRHDQCRANTVVNGNIGSSTSIDVGVTHPGFAAYGAGSPQLANAQASLLTAYGFAEAQTPNQPTITGVNLAGKTLAPRRLQLHLRAS